MENLRKGLSDFFSLIIPKDNDEYYTWKEILIGLVFLLFLLAAGILLKAAT